MLIYLLKLTNEGGFNIEVQLKYVDAVPDPIILPTPFNDDSNVDALETNKLERKIN